MRLNYKDMVIAAKDAGLTNESTMWESVDEISEFLEEMRMAHPKEYWIFMRKQYGLLNHGHYGQEFAEYDVNNMKHMEDGREVRGAFWSKAQTDEVYAAYKSRIRSPYNDWDVYVALNAQYHDYVSGLKKRRPDSYEHDLIDEAIDFWFNDEDWPGDCKIWTYMCTMQKR